MKFLIALMLLSLPAYASEFITVDTLKCFVDEQSYTECGVIFKNVRIKKDIIRAFYPAFSTEVGYDTKSGEVIVKKVNVERCVIQTDKVDMDIDMKCYELEKALK